MSKTPDESLKSRKRLGLMKKEINLQRHPSVKSLFSEIDTITKDDSNNYIANEINTINIINSISSSKNNNHNFKRINIITCEHKLNNNETFFIKVNPEESESNNDNSKKTNNNNIDNLANINIQYDEPKTNATNKNNIKNNSNKLKLNKPSFYGFSDQQKDFDKRITDSMAEGKDFTYIENSFKGLLKTKK